MREIKFRGKRWDNGEWVYGDLRHWNNGEIGIVQNPIHQRSDSVCGYPVGAATVGQYTGLKDKNGREIYEGDVVVAWSEGRRGIFSVMWRQEATPCWLLYPAWQDKMFWKLDGRVARDGTYHDDVEVVGNIHDNPDLLKEEA